MRNATHFKLPQALLAGGVVHGPFETSFVGFQVLSIQTSGILWMLRSPLIPLATPQSELEQNGVNLVRFQAGTFVPLEFDRFYIAFQSSFAPADLELLLYTRLVASPTR